MADVKHFLDRKSSSAMLAGTTTAKVLQDILYQQQYLRNGQMGGS